jgi:hypothetical protein
MTCTHLDAVHDVTPSSNGCEDCLRIGGQWVAHFHSEQHPLIQSYEPAEDWWYCYLDDVAFLLDGAPSFAHA